MDHHPDAPGGPERLTLRCGQQIATVEPDRGEITLGRDPSSVLRLDYSWLSRVHVRLRPERNYWLAGEGTQGADAETWLEKAESVPGSWWPEWRDWLADRSSAMVMARRRLGASERGYPPLEAAPGTIRADYALDVGENVIHGSDGLDSAARELALHFPELG